MQAGQTLIATSTNDASWQNLPQATSGFSVYASSSQSVAPVTLTKVAYDTAEYDVASEFDTTNHKFTATNAGKYLFTFTAYINSLASGKVFQLFVYKNGSQVKQTQSQSAGGANLITNMTCIIELAASDYIELFISHDDSVNRTITPAAGQTNTWAMGQRLA